METNTAEKKKRPVYLKPLNPRLTAEDRLDADLRLLSRALRAWECKMRPSARQRRPPTPDRCLPRDRFIASPVEDWRGELGPNRESSLPQVSPEE
jgi:hypothetical protein